jgi:hypothetical protein
VRLKRPQRERDADSDDHEAPDEHRQLRMIERPGAARLDPLGEIAHRGHEHRDRVPLSDCPRDSVHPGDRHERSRQERERKDNREPDPLDRVRRANEHPEQHAGPREREHPEQHQPGELKPVEQRQVRAPPEREAEHDDDHHAEQLLDELAGDLGTDDRQPADRHRTEAVDDALAHVVRGGDAGTDDSEASDCPMIPGNM